MLANTSLISAFTKLLTAPSARAARDASSTAAAASVKRPSSVNVLGAVQMQTAEERRVLLSRLEADRLRRALIGSLKIAIAQIGLAQPREAVGERIAGRTHPLDIGLVDLSNRSPRSRCPFSCSACPSKFSFCK